MSLALYLSTQGSSEGAAAPSPDDAVGLGQLGLPLPAQPGASTLAFGANDEAAVRGLRLYGPVYQVPFWARQPIQVRTGGAVYPTPSSEVAAPEPAASGALSGSSTPSGSGTPSGVVPVTSGRVGRREQKGQTEQPRLAPSWPGPASPAQSSESLPSPSPRPRRSLPTPRPKQPRHHQLVARPSRPPRFAPTRLRPTPGRRTPPPLPPAGFRS